MRILEARGTPYEIGYAIGAQARELVTRAVDFLVVLVAADLGLHERRQRRGYLVSCAQRHRVERRIAVAL